MTPAVGVFESPTAGGHPLECGVAAPVRSGVSHNLLASASMVVGPGVDRSLHFHRMCRYSISPASSEPRSVTIVAMLTTVEIEVAHVLHPAQHPRAIVTRAVTVELVRTPPVELYEDMQSRDISVCSVGALDVTERADAKRTVLRVIETHRLFNGSPARRPRVGLVREPTHGCAPVSRHQDHAGERYAALRAAHTGPPRRRRGAGAAPTRSRGVSSGAETATGSERRAIMRGKNISSFAHPGAPQTHTSWNSESPGTAPSDRVPTSPRGQGSAKSRDGRVDPAGIQLPRSEQVQEALSATAEQHG
jgi:hypothetical protein